MVRPRIRRHSQGMRKSIANHLTEIGVVEGCWHGMGQKRVCRDRRQHVFGQKRARDLRSNALDID